MSDPEVVAAPSTVVLRSATGRGVLAAAILGTGMAFMDATIANVATKTIGIEFHASFASLQWVINGYQLTLASLILLGGSLGDRLGRKRIYLIGVVWFAAASLLCAVSWNVQTLIAARALQGIGGALMTPGSLAIITSAFRVEDRAVAVGAWSGLSGVSTALGPIVGGWLVQSASWRWAFGLNLPLAAAVVLLGIKFIPESRSEHRSKHLDYIGTFLVAAGLASLTYGLTRAGTTWDFSTVVSTGLGVVLLVAFTLYQLRTPGPLVPLGLFRNTTFSAANVMTFFTYAALGTLFTLLVLQLQIVAGYRPLLAGLSGLPVTAALLLLSARSGALATRIGPRLQLVAGPLIAAAGMALLMRIDTTHRSYVYDVLPGVLVFALGLAALVAPLTATVMGSAPANDVGIASAVNNAVARAAGLLGVAVLPSMAGLHAQNYLVPKTMSHGFRMVMLSCIALLIAGSAAATLIGRDKQGHHGIHG